MNLVGKAYRQLLKRYGPQGWWPIVNARSGKCVYAPGRMPEDKDCFEISMGAILTQNVAWKNVETAIANLKKNGLFTPRKLHAAPAKKFAPLIRSTGYYNQKAIKIRHFLEWYKGYNYSFKKLRDRALGELREELLDVKGIGPETADSILLYGLGMKIFVIDAYTRRIFTRLGVLEGNETYDEIQRIFHKRFRGEAPEYNEYHALIVAHGKDICRNKPLCGECCLLRICIRRGLSGKEDE